MIAGIPIKSFIIIFGLFVVSTLSPYILMKYTEKKKLNG
jgi:hypothetical protein